jgi:hypothetical protein
MQGHLLQSQNASMEAKEWHLSMTEFTSEINSELNQVVEIFLKATFLNMSCL